MKWLELLRAKRAELDTTRAALVARMEAATAAAEAEGRSELSDEESVEFAAALVELRGTPATDTTPEVRGLDAEIDELDERIAELTAIDERARLSPGSPQIMRRVEVDESVEVATLTRGAARDQALALLEQRSGEINTASGDRITALVRSSRTDNYDPDQVARRMLVTESDAYRSAWMKAVTAVVPAFTPEEARALAQFEELRAMSSTTTAGGFGVPVLIDPTIILTAQGALNPIEALARVETITTDAWKGVSSAGVTWSFDTEATEVSDDAPTVAQPVVNVHEARGFIPFSIRIGQDYPGFADEMSTLLSEGYNELKAQKFTVGAGDGSKEPFGIFTALDANTNVEVVVTSDGVLQGADINKVWGALPDRYKTNATWLMSHDVGNEVATFGNGNNLSFVTVDLAGVIETIRKRPVAFASYAPDFTGNTGAANLLTVGDFRNYLIAQRIGMTVELVPHLLGTTNGRPTGERGWFAFARVGADSVNDLGFRLLQNT
jgi:HK97 family phage major capsid protein